MAKTRGKKSTAKIKDLPARKLSAKQAKSVKGGGKKHIAGVKYEDITVNCGTGMAKGFYNWTK